MRRVSRRHRQARRQNPVSRDFWDTPLGLGVQVVAGVGVVAGVYSMVRSWGPSSAGFELPIATGTLLQAL